VVDQGTRLEFVVRQDEAGQRIDRVLVDHLDRWGRRAAARLFAAGQVSLDGRRARKGDLVHAGQQVLAFLESPDSVEPSADLALDLVLVTPDVVIVNKRPGIASAPVPTSPRQNVATALAARFPEMASVGYREREPGLVHRLDTFTSGLLLAARTAHAFDCLRKALREGRLRKRYLAIVQGPLDDTEGVIDAPLATRTRRARKVVVAVKGRAATTHYRVASRHGALVVLEVSAAAAYRHQIRAHLASIGCPLVNDELYGGSPHAGLAAGRHALHASYMACDETGIERFTARAPLPDDLSRVLESDG
jgi:23S rRNA pseudouridine1911/1915/1917 synthase